MRHLDAFQSICAVISGELRLNNLGVYLLYVLVGLSRSLGQKHGKIPKISTIYFEASA